MKQVTFLFCTRPACFHTHGHAPATTDVHVRTQRRSLKKLAGRILSRSLVASCDRCQYSHENVVMVVWVLALLRNVTLSGEGAPLDLSSDSVALCDREGPELDYGHRVGQNSSWGFLGVVFQKGGFLRHCKQCPDLKRFTVWSYKYTELTWHLWHYKWTKP